MGIVRACMCVQYEMESGLNDVMGHAIANLHGNGYQGGGVGFLYHTPTPTARNAFFSGALGVC